MANGTTDDAPTLVLALLVRAGSIMEDESPALIAGLAPEEQDADLARRINRLARVAADLAALAAAAAAVLRSDNH